MKDNIMKITLIINGKEISAMLEDNETAKALFNMLPLEIDMSDLNGNEKYYYLNVALPNDPKSVGVINFGDIMLYGNDCLVIFYETFNTSYHYTKIGNINLGSLKEIIGEKNVIVRIEK